MRRGEAALSAASVSRPPHRGAVLLAVYNALYWPYLLVSCVVLFAPALVIFLVTFGWDKQRSWLHAYTSWWGAHYLAWAPLAGVRVEGRENALGAEPCVYVSNHLSMVDILAAFAIRLRYRWVSKLENFLVPFLGLEHGAQRLRAAQARSPAEHSAHGAPLPGMYRRRPQPFRFSGGHAFGGRKDQELSIGAPSGSRPETRFRWCPC